MPRNMENLKLKLHTPFDSPSYNLTEKIIQFVAQNSPECNNCKTNIQRSIDHALKNIPTSLGGYIITLSSNNGELAGVSILNRTGLGGIMSEYIISHMAIHPKYANAEIWQKKLLNKTLDICNGDVTFLIKANNPMINACVEHGFEYQRMEMVYLKSSGESIQDQLMAQRAK